MSILYLTLGGTIACTRDERGRARASLDAKDLLTLANSPLDVRGEDFLAVPSSDLTFDHLVILRDRLHKAFHEEGFQGVVISQGTDTIEEVAYALHLWEAWPGPVVVTGSMRHHDLLGYDGPANLAASFAVVRSKDARGQGVFVVMGDQIHSAGDVTKFHTQSPATFQSPNWGPVGIVHEGRVTFGRRVTPSVILPAPKVSARVDLLKLCLDTHPDLARASLAADGIVLEATGGGHVPVRLLPILDEAISMGKVVVATSRAATGPALRETYGAFGAEFDLQERGVLMGDGPGTKLRIRMALALSMTPRPDLEQIAAAWV